MIRGCLAWLTVDGEEFMLVPTVLGVPKVPCVLLVWLDWVAPLTLDPLELSDWEVDWNVREDEVASEDVDVNEEDGVGDTVEPGARLKEEELELEVMAVFSVLVLRRSVWFSRFSPYSNRMEELSRQRGWLARRVIAEEHAIPILATVKIFLMAQGWLTWLKTRRNSRPGSKSLNPRSCYSG
jgi:hypothetical protein